MGIGLYLIELDSIRLALDLLDAALLNNRTYSNGSQRCMNMKLFLYRLGLNITLLDNRL